MNERATDVAIVGFGFAGLATLMHLTEAGATAPRSITVIAPEDSGRGLAYSTTDPLHLLNVPAHKMGAWGGDPEDFVRWLRTPRAAAAAAGLGVPVTAPGDFAPRVLFAAYLDELREGALRAAREHRFDVRWVGARASEIRRDATGWTIRAGSKRVAARACVLCTGNDPRGVFGELTHPDLHDGPWALDPAIAGEQRPVALIGSGLTAVDSLLTLRRLGFRGEVVALSRNGLLPRRHRPPVLAPALPRERIDRITTLDAVVGLVAELQTEGHDWRGAVDALRPHTQELWQRLSPEDRQTAVNGWGPTWNVYRHRMAPEPAAVVAAELASGGLTVIATPEIDPEVVDGHLELAYTPRDGAPGRLAPAVVIDCTGPQLDCARSGQPLLRGLVRDGIVTRHHTGLGLAADADLQVAPGLYAIGSLLTGQLWETIAVPELRDQAAAIAQHLAGAGEVGEARPALSA